MRYQAALRPEEGRILPIEPAQVNRELLRMLRVLKLSGSVARHLSGCHSALKGVRDETDEVVTGDTEDEI